MIYDWCIGTFCSMTYMGQYLSTVLIGKNKQLDREGVFFWILCCKFNRLFYWRPFCLLSYADNLHMKCQFSEEEHTKFSSHFSKTHIIIQSVLLWHCSFFFVVFLPASVAQLNVRSFGDQEVADSITARFSDMLTWRLIMKYFLWSFSPFADWRRAVVSFWWKNVHKYWLIA